MSRNKARAIHAVNDRPLSHHWFHNGFLVALVLCFLPGCSDDDTVEEESAEASGSLTIYLTDAPIDDAKSVNIVFTGMLIQPADEDENDDIEPEPISVEFAEPQTLDLLQVQGANSTLLLDGVALPTGQYDWIRLLVNAESNVLDSTIVFEGETDAAEDDEIFSLFIPSGDETGLKLNRPFSVSANGNASFTVDFDLRKSIKRRQGNNYRMRPTLRIVDNLEIGHIDGTIAANLIADPACVDGLFGVYVYTGEPAVLDDIGSAAEPLTAGAVTLVDNNNEQVGEYEIGFLEPGDYTVGLTCQANLDNPELDDDIVFLQSKVVTVEIDNMNTVDFP